MEGTWEWNRCLGVDVSEHGLGAAVEHAVGRRGEGDGADDDLVPFPKARRHGRQVQRRRAVAHHHRIPGASDLAELLFRPVEDKCKHEL